MGIKINEFQANTINNSIIIFALASGFLNQQTELFYKNVAILWTLISLFMLVSGFLLMLLMKVFGRFCQENGKTTKYRLFCKMLFLQK